MRPEPTVQDFITEAATVTRAHDNVSDFVRGSDYEALAGANAIIWSRQAARDTDLFYSTRLLGAQGPQLTRLVKQRYGIDRILDTRGRGTALLTRASGGEETLWRGTRIRYRPTAGADVFYQVRVDTPVASGVLTVSVPIEAVAYGPTSQLNVNSGLTVEDATVSSWLVSSIACAAGTRFESASDLIARVRRTREESRVGFSAAIIKACRDAGASEVVLFPGNYGGDETDLGLNVCYVGDSGYSTSADMLKACRLAVRQARVLGDHMQVFPMDRVEIDVIADITLRDAPDNFDLVRLESTHAAAIRRYMNDTSGTFGYSREGLTSAISIPTPEVQDVDFESPSSDVGILVNGQFPPTLNRYVVDVIRLRYHGP